MEKKYKNLLFLFILSLLSFSTLRAQHIDLCDSVTTPGHIVVIADTALNAAIASAGTLENKTPQMPGYRIQIFSGNDRNAAAQAKENFLKSYPNQPAYLDYSSPDFRIRVGDFRNKLEAQKLLHELQETLGGGVFLVPDKINFPQLK